MSEASAKVPLIFADSNVFIQALVVVDSAASIVIRMADAGQFAIVTSASVKGEVERALAGKTQHNAIERDKVFQRWNTIVSTLNLTVHDDPAADAVRACYNTYLPLMRHRNDIPVLAAALDCKPDYILSGNREHFNDAVSKRCGIPIFSCSEFIEFVVG